MCLAVPAEVLSIQDGMADCRIGSGQATLRASTMLLPEPPEPGDFLVIHAGFALRILNRGEAEKSLRLLRETTCPAQG